MDFQLSKKIGMNTKKRSLLSAFCFEAISRYAICTSTIRLISSAALCVR